MNGNNNRALKEVASLLGTNPNFLVPFRNAVKKVANENRAELSKVYVHLNRPNYAEEFLSRLRKKIVISENILLKKFSSFNDIASL